MDRGAAGSAIWLRGTWTLAGCGGSGVGISSAPLCPPGNFPWLWLPGVHCPSSWGRSLGSVSLRDLSPGVPSGARAQRLGHPLPGFSCLGPGELQAPLMAWEDGWVRRSSMLSSVFSELVCTAPTTPSGTSLGGSLCLLLNIGWGKESTR